LSEINFGDLERANIVIFAIVEALKFDFDEFLAIFKGRNLPKINIQSLQNCKKGHFHTSWTTKIDFKKLEKKSLLLPIYVLFGIFQPHKRSKIHENQNSKPQNVFKWQFSDL